MDAVAAAFLRSRRGGRAAASLAAILALAVPNFCMRYARSRSQAPSRIRAKPSGAKIKVKEKPVTKNEKTTKERFRRRRAMKPSPQNARTMAPSNSQVSEIGHRSP